MMHIHNQSLEYRSGARIKNFFRMSGAIFEEILNMIASKITKMDTNMREAAPVHERLKDAEWTINPSMNEFQRKIQTSLHMSCEKWRKYCKLHPRGTQHFREMICCTNFLSRELTFYLTVHKLGYKTCSHNLKNPIMRVTPTVHTTTVTCCMLHNLAVRSCITKFLFVWTRLY